MGFCRFAPDRTSSLLKNLYFAKPVVDRVNEYRKILLYKFL